MTSMLRDSQNPRKYSMKRVLAMLMLPAVYVALFKGRDWQTVTALIGGGIIPLLKKDQPTGNKESAPTT